MEEVKKDKRFSHISKDPRFHNMRKKDRKVMIDKRFRGMMKDSRFKLKYTVDPRGKPMRMTTNENLQRFYELSSSDMSSESEDKGDDTDDEDSGCYDSKKKKTKDLKSQKTKKELNVSDKKKKSLIPNDDIKAKAVMSDVRRTQLSDDTDDDEDDDDNDVDEDDVDEDDDVDNVDEDDESSDEDEKDLVVDRARGVGVVSSSEESDDSDTDKDEEDIDHEWAELDREAPTVPDATHRLAVCHMDWDRLKADDLMVLFNSFKAPGGVIKSVTIYPSEYGLARMKEEDVSGPNELKESKRVRESKFKSSSKSEEGEEYHREKLRQYQLNRLRYYYAVLDCDSEKTAAHIYEQCDGLEYETTSTKLDLRFIPDDMVFDATPTSEVRDVPEAVTYKPSQFTNSALQQSKVQLTWDETDRDRVKLKCNKLSAEELEHLDMTNYLASDSDELDEDPYAGIEDPDFGLPEDQADTDGKPTTEAEQIEKYRELIKNLQKSDNSKPSELKGEEMEISWEPGLMESAKKVKEKKEKGSLTPWEEYQKKRKEKRKQRREEKREKKKKYQQEAGEEEQEQKEYSDDDLPAGIDLTDPYFKEELDKVKPPTEKKKKKKESAKKKKKMKEDEAKEDTEGLSLLVMDDEDDKAHFNMADIQAAQQRNPKKKKNKPQDKVEDNFEISVDDPRFSEVYDNPHYNIDPTAPEFKKTHAMNCLIEEKLRRREQGVNPVSKKKSEKRTMENEMHTEQTKKKKKHVASETDASVPTKDYALSNLVKSVKAKTKNLQNKKLKKGNKLEVKLNL